MSPSAVPADLMNGSECIDRCIPDGMKMAVLINIFAKLANMSTNPKDLMDGAVCIDRCIPDGMKMAALIYVATQITTGGGGGGVTATPVNTGIVNLDDSWTNNTGAPVYVVATVDLATLSAETAEVGLKVNGTTKGTALRSNSGSDNDRTVMPLSAIVLPGETLLIANVQESIGNLLDAIFAWQLS